MDSGDAWTAIKRLNVVYNYFGWNIFFFSGKKVKVHLPFLLTVVAKTDSNFCIFVFNTEMDNLAKLNQLMCHIVRVSIQEGEGRGLGT